MKKIINKIFYHFFGYIPYPKSNPNSFLTRPIKCKTEWPSKNITQEQWERGDWIKERNDWLVKK